MNTDAELKKYMKAIAKANRFDQVVLRGCVTGIFSAIGTAISFGIILYVLANFLQDQPFVDELLRITKIDALIESQLYDTQQPVKEETPDENTVDNNEPISYFVEYSNAKYNISFSYPSYLTGVNEIGTQENFVLEFIGEGLVDKLVLNINPGDILVSGTANIQKVEVEEKELPVYIYESGASVDGEKIDSPVFFTKYEKGDYVYNFIGIGDEERPKLAREAFLKVVESIE